jgi:hypothetical protein
MVTLRMSKSITFFYVGLYHDVAHRLVTPSELRFIARFDSYQPVKLSLSYGVKVSLEQKCIRKQWILLSVF